MQSERSSPSEEKRRLRFLGLLGTVSGQSGRKRLPECVDLASKAWREAGDQPCLYSAALLGYAEIVYSERRKAECESGERKPELNGLRQLDAWLGREIFRREKEKEVLLPLFFVCLDSALYRALCEQRPGIAELRRSAFHTLLTGDMQRLTHTVWGELERNWLEAQLGNRRDVSGQWQKLMQKIEGAMACRSAEALVSRAVTLYTMLSERGFRKKFRVVGKETGEEEGSDHGQKEETLFQITGSSDGERKEHETRGAGEDLILDDASMARVEASIEHQFGKSFLTQKALDALTGELCVGVHSGCRLHFTDGLSKDVLRSSSSMEGFYNRIREENQSLLEEHRAQVHQSIRSISDAFCNAVRVREEKDTYHASFGRLIPSKLWNLGRTNNPNLFLREIQNEKKDFVVDILLDGSGSLQSRQGMVALQGYILSEALDEVQIPHRVMSFCTLGDFTVLRRFRDYEGGHPENLRIFEYYGSCNNRDGLAVKACAAGLLDRPEEKRILLMLSDGIPNDQIVSQKRAKLFPSYTGEYAVWDSAKQIRALRRKGITVIGLFVGEEEELEDEKIIFGNSFAYLNGIENFSRIAGSFLKRELSE